MLALARLESAAEASTEVMVRYLEALGGCLWPEAALVLRAAVASSVRLGLGFLLVLPVLLFPAEVAGGLGALAVRLFPG
jgi:hypothetical protein